jgi:YD repeat-containing protein
MNIDAYTYAYNVGNQRTSQTFTKGNYEDYTYDNIGQLTGAQGWEADTVTPCLHEQWGYGYDAAWNLNYRTNNALVQTFNVNNLNALTTTARSGTLTVAGTATEAEGSMSGPNGVTSVTVSGTGLSSGAAALYADGTWARAGAALADGNNTYTAIGQDTYGRLNTNSVTVNAPAGNTFVYDLNGNLRTNDTRVLDYDSENQLVRITEPNVWKSEFAYDALQRRRVSREYAWVSSAWVETNEVHYIYDGRVVVQERDINNLPTVTYTRGNDLSTSRQGAGGIGGLLARSINGLLTADLPAHAYYITATTTAT